MPSSSIAAPRGAFSRGAVPAVMCWLAVGTGCGTVRSWIDTGVGSSTTGYAISLHRTATSVPPDSRLFTVLSARDGRAVRVHATPLLSSQHIRLAEVVRSANGRLAVGAKLDDHGRFVWMQASVEHSGCELALAIDGEFRFMVRVEGAAGTEADVLLEGPWEPQEAEMVAERAAANYKALRRK